jgi:S-adenosylmethionine synthetase
VNSAGGVIEPLRPAGVEAPAGKNPLHHAGKIYTALARRAAQAITAASGRYCEVTVTAHNGDPLDAPAAVLVSLAGPFSTEAGALAREVVATAMAEAPAYHRDFLAQHAEAGEGP